MTPAERLAHKITVSKRDARLRVAERRATEDRLRREAAAQEARCQATTLLGHRCIHPKGHAGAHIGTLAASGLTEWCRWDSHSNDDD